MKEKSLALATKLIDLLESEKALYGEAAVALDVAKVILPSAHLPVYEDPSAK
jgi:hypothetical protein